MLRYEPDCEQHPTAPPFRVLSPGGRLCSYEAPRPRHLHSSAPPPAPPSSRAPEPYKVAPQGSSFGRNQRKSSFAIIAETRPPSPLQPAAGAPRGSRPGSPALSGRLSPFRGRGFRGPGERPSRASVSQQASPRRSQIPRPARSRSGSLGRQEGPAGRPRPSPRFGRRAAVGGYASSVGNGSATRRREARGEAAKRPELSPIQGTPTRPSAEKAKNNVASAKPAAKDVGSQRTTRSPGKVNRNLLTLPKNVQGNKRFVTPKSPTPQNNNSASRESPDSPSKIPLRRGSVEGSTTSMAKQSPAKLTAASSKDSSNNPANQTQKQTQSKADQDKSSKENVMITSRKKHSAKEVAPPSTTEDDLGLVDLLKQSSGATGTSSVVNTTTTTAVQPLQIDATPILVESELVAKLANLERKQKNLEIENANLDSQKPMQSSSSKKAQENNNKTSPGRSQQPTLPNDSTKEDTVEEISSAKNGNLTNTMIKHFGPNSVKDNKNQLPSSNTAGTLGSVKTSEAQASAMSEAERQKEENIKRILEEQDKQQQQQQQEVTAAATEPKKADNKVSIAKIPSKTTISTNDVKKVTVASRASSPTDRVANVNGKDQQSNGEKKNNEGSIKFQAPAVSSESLGSIRSTDTGVSVNTVRGVSSAKEKMGLHLVKRSDEIETLSGNIVHLESNGDHAPAATTTEAAGTRGGTAGAWRRLRDCWPDRRSRLGAPAAKAGATAWPGARPRRAFGRCWPEMRCLALQRAAKPRLWPGAGKQTRTQLAPGPKGERWARIKEACRCAKPGLGACAWRGVARRRRRTPPQVAPQPANAAPTTAPLAAKPAGSKRRRRWPRAWRGCGWRWRRRDREPAAAAAGAAATTRGPSVRAKPSLTSVVAPPLSEESRHKIPDVLVEHGSLMRAAIPCLPLPLAWLCLACNVLLPGSGTLLSGLFNLCAGQPRFSATAGPKARLGALLVDVVVGLSQLFTVLFCLVGWGWSIWWGVTMVRLAKKYKRFRASEAAATDPEARAGPEAATLPAPGVPPTQALRNSEQRAR